MAFLLLKLFIFTVLGVQLVEGAVVLGDCFSSFILCWFYLFRGCRRGIFVVWHPPWS